MVPVIPGQQSSKMQPEQILHSEIVAGGLVVSIQVLLCPHRHCAGRTVSADGLCHSENWCDFTGNTSRFCWQASKLSVDTMQGQADSELGGGLPFKLRAAPALLSLEVVRLGLKGPRL